MAAAHITTTFGDVPLSYFNEHTTTLLRYGMQPTPWWRPFERMRRKAALDIVRAKAEEIAFQARWDAGA